jgi:hypothetical protein
MFRCLPAQSERARGSTPDRTGYPKPSRYFDGTMRTAERLCGSPIQIEIEGTQFASGDIERLVRCAFIGHGDDVLTADQARELARALSAAADELDALGTTSI